MAAGREAEDAPLISIQSGMLVALGFLIASLVGLLLASAFWSRAVRLTTKRIKQSMPVSEPEIKADRDRLRAAYAVKVHELETRLDQAKLERARQLIEINRRDATISTLETDVVTVKADLEENQNARRVLEQTVADRLPKVEARLAETKRLLFNRDREIAELAQGAKRHKQALEEASSINAQKAAQIERLNVALTTHSGRARRPASAPRPEGEGDLRAEVDALRTKTRDQATLIDRLQRRLGHGYIVPAPASATPQQQPRDEEADLDAEAASNGASPAPATADAQRPEHEREIRALKARAEDQAGEIARLKAALAAFEQTGTVGGGLKNSKLALKARIGSAEAQAERQAATISRLRAELAATHERLARQAAHFMDEMRRMGSGPSTAPGQGRRPGDGGRRNLVDRVAQVRPAVKPAIARPPAADAGEMPSGADIPANGHAGSAQEAQPPPAAAVSASAPAGPVAEMPQTTAIPEERRKRRLLDRLTGMAKG
jgi:hypothetical protein